LCLSCASLENSRAKRQQIHLPPVFLLIFSLSPTMPGPLSLFAVAAVLIMSTDDSSRIFAKYYTPPHLPAGVSGTSPNHPSANPYPTVKEQKAFEKGLVEKTNKQMSDVILYDNRVVVFKVESDLMLYVVGSAEENEILLYNVVLSLRDALGILFKCVEPCTLHLLLPRPFFPRKKKKIFFFFFFFLESLMLYMFGIQTPKKYPITRC
jgi:hypothetical protein